MGLPEIVGRSYEGHRFLLSLFHRFGYSEISKFQHSFLVNKDILWFNISVNDLMLMKVDDALHELDEEVHDKFLLEQLPLFLHVANIH
jgi:hypothetical protein